METIVFKQSNDQSISKAKSILQSGGVIAVPTDTVYGIACLVSDPNSIQLLYSIKERDLLKAIPVLIGALDQISNISKDLPESAHILAHNFWPGALTLVVNKHHNLPQELTTFPTVGVRMPNHNWLRQLMDLCGPLAVTSANMSGEPSLATAHEVLDALSGKVDLLIDGGTCEGGIPSTVVDCTQSPIKILREGGIAKNMIYDSILENS
ncbi:MAG: L-threonylcarbamoyladenylate synthase [Pelolinea sp.]|nr:L-threonylcarbamoyladenylate synthase [Pelolinea sp.]